MRRNFSAGLGRGGEAPLDNSQQSREIGRARDNHPGSYSHNDPASSTLTQPINFSTATRFKTPAVALSANDGCRAAGLSSPMSLDSVRSGVERDKRNELLNIETSRKRKLRELYAITSYINANQPPTLSLPDPPTDVRELQFLDDNDIAKGRYFREDTLPALTSPKQVAKPSQPTAVEPTAPAVVSKASAPIESTQDADAPGSPADTASPAIHASPSTAQEPAKPPTPEPTPSQAPPTDEVKPHVESRPAEDKNAPKPSADAPETPAPVASKAQPPPAIPEPQAPRDAPPVEPRRIRSSIPDGATILPDPQTLDRPARKPRTIHLPPKEVQEQRLRELHDKERAAQREKREEEHLTAGGENVNGEVASSPSSTLGPHSANTSRADQHSPATSPDEETPRHDVSFSGSQRPGVEKDRDAVSTPDEMARNVPDITPDAQLRFEESVRQARDSAKVTDNAVSKAKTADLSKQVSKEAAQPNGIVDGTTQESSKSQHTVNGIDPETTSKAPKETPDARVKNSKTKRASIDGLAVQDITMEDADALKAKESKTGSPVLRRHELPDANQQGPKTARVSDAVSEVPSTTKPPLATEEMRPTSLLLKGRDAEYRDREKSKAAGVIFAKQDSALLLGGGQTLNKAWIDLKGAAQDPDKDYLIGMFDFQAHSGPLFSCRELLDKATKTYSTASKYASIREQQDYKILKRIYTLQHANRWSMRQMEKSAEPPRQITYHDSLLAQMKWMRTDFREERRWKTAAARNMAEWCAEWVAASPQKRLSLQVKPTRKPAAQPPPVDPMEEDIPSPPELIPSGANETESESFPEDDELPINLRSSHPPAALFSLGYEDIVAKIDNIPISEKVLQELPSYESRLKGFPSPSVLGPVTNETDIIPVSQLVTAKLVPKTTEPPRKRSRFEYEEEDDSGSYSTRRPTSERSNASTPSLRFSRMGLSPEQTDVALFLPENKHVRDRLHAGHAFRPPSEFPMPSTAFFESRAPSQWLWDEDQRLRALVKEYQFNWSLVAASLDQPSIFTSGAERRTPWECFERWVQLEGLPGEMAKTPYFRTYQARLEAAQRTVTAQYQAAQQQAQQQGQPPGQSLNTPRRRTAQPIRVERRRGNRFLALIDAMRKQARKRETAQHKQQEAAKAAALRKAHEAAPVRNSVHTPQEFSKLKYEREQKMAEKQEEYRRQMLAAQRQAMARPGQMPGHPGMAGGLAQQRNGTPNGAHGQVPGQNGQLHPNMGMQGRPHPGQGMQGNMPNGNMSGMPMSIPQAQMQMNMQGQRLQPQQAQDMRIAMQQRNLSNLTQQQQYAMQQQAQQMNRANNMSGVHMGGGNNNMQNSAMLAANMGAPKVNGGNNGGMNGMQGSAGSPRMAGANHATPQPQALSSGHVPQITNLTHEIQLQHPNLSQAEASRIASDRMNQKLQQNARQNALNAAAGATAAGTSNNAPHMSPSPYQQHAGLANSGGSASPSNHNPQQQAAYQQQMRQHMMQQQRSQSGQQGSPTLNSVRPESRSATPQQNMQQGQQGQHGSPRAPGQQQQGGQQGGQGSPPGSR